MAMIKCILSEQERGVRGAAILKDRVNEKKYNLIVTEGFLNLQEVSPDTPEKDIELIDTATGQLYKLIVENSILGVEEV